MPNPDKRIPSDPLATGQPHAVCKWGGGGYVCSLVSAYNINPLCNTHTLRPPKLHPLDSRHKLDTHSTHIRHTLYTHSTRTIPTVHTHTHYTHTPSTNTLSTHAYTLQTQTPHTHSTHSTHTLHTLITHSINTLHALFTHSTSTLHALYPLSPHPPPHTLFLVSANFPSNIHCETPWYKVV